MCTSCQCLNKLSKLNVIAYISGWLGIIWRIVLISFISTITSWLTEYDPTIYWIIIISCLTYFLASAIINLIFLYGVYKERRHFLLPYITIVGLEIVVGAILGIGIVILLFAVNSIIYGIYAILVALFIVGVHVTLWLHNIFFYKALQHNAVMKKFEMRNISHSGI